MIQGEGGVIVLLSLAIVFIMNGKVLPKSYVDDLRETNKLNSAALDEQSKSLETLSRTSAEALENSYTSLKILTEIRRQTGVEGDETSD